MSDLYRLLSLLTTVLLLTAGCGALRPADPPAGPEPPAAATVKTAPAEATETIEEFWPDGSVRIRREVIREADGTEVLHGTYARWHENGRPEYETLFNYGKKDGQAVRWHMNGKVWIEEFYVNGLKEGSCRTWNEAGDLVKEENYARGKPHGTWMVWKKGKVKARSCFDHGVPVACEPLAAPEEHVSVE